MALAMLVLGRFDRRLLTSRPIIVPSAVNAAAFALQNVGLTMATSAALLININVGIEVLLAAVMLKETITSRTIYGPGIGLAGAMIISTGGPGIGDSQLLARRHTGLQRRRAVGLLYGL